MEAGMSEDVIVAAHIDSEIRDRAEKVANEAGLTLPDVFRMVAIRAAEDGTLPYDPDYEDWITQQIQEALEDTSPGIPSEEVEAYFAEKRARLLASLKD